MSRHRPAGLHSKLGRLFLSIPIAIALWAPASTALGPSVALAATCPSGWSAVTDASVPTVTLFCRKFIALGYPDAYFIKVPAQHMGQTIEQPSFPCVNYAGSSSNPNPIVQKRNVANWLSTWRGCGYNIGIVINGTFFRDTDDTHSTTDISYPLLSSSPGWITGYDTTLSRVCFGFGGLNAVPAAAPWDITTTG